MNKLSKYIIKEGTEFGPIGRGLKIPGKIVSGGGSLLSGTLGKIPVLGVPFNIAGKALKGTGMAASSMLSNPMKSLIAYDFLSPRIKKRLGAYASRVPMATPIVDRHLASMR